MKDPILALLSCIETHFSASFVDESSVSSRIDYDTAQVAMVSSVKLPEGSQGGTKCPS